MMLYLLALFYDFIPATCFLKNYEDILKMRKDAAEGTAGVHADSE